MAYRKCPNWPPTWTWIGGKDNTHPKGEIGILEALVPSAVYPLSRLFLVIEHGTAVYMGALLFDDSAFCRQLQDLLQSQTRRSIQEIGDLEVGHLL
ncbi:MAG TPA: hypothetical protein VGL11_07655 [Candidatus Binatia bacterium]|jgi:hypothetical protein